jgi:hypothetical protein
MASNSEPVIDSDPETLDRTLVFVGIDSSKASVRWTQAA